jgi:hypothetical protein
MVTAAKLRPAMDIERRFPQRSAVSTARAGTDVAHRPRPQRSRFASKRGVSAVRAETLAQDEEQHR